MLTQLHGPDKKCSCVNVYEFLKFRSCKFYQTPIISANWDAIKNEISYSNVIQRDNLVFAKKLDKNLVAIAVEGDKHVRINTHFNSVHRSDLMVASILRYQPPSYSTTS